MSNVSCQQKQAFLESIGLGALFGTLVEKLGPVVSDWLVQILMKQSQQGALPIDVAKELVLTIAKDALPVAYDAIVSLLAGRTDLVSVLLAQLLKSKRDEIIGKVIDFIAQKFSSATVTPTTA